MLQEKIEREWEKREVTKDASKASKDQNPKDKLEDLPHLVKHMLGATKDAQGIVGSSQGPSPRDELDQEEIGA